MKAKRIILISLSSLLLLIMLTLLTFSFYKVDHKFNLNQPSTIAIVSPNLTDEETIDTESKYNEILNLYNQSFKENYLTALFKGLAFKQVTKDTSIYQSVSTLKRSGYYMLHFYYNEPQEYESNNTKRTYTEVYIQIIPSNSLIEVNAYIKSQSSTYCQCKLTTYAKQQDLYNRIKSI